MKTISKILLAMILLLWGAVVCGAAAALPAAPSWYEHADVMEWVIGGLFSLVLFLMLRTLSKVDRNQNRLFERLDALTKEFYMLQGEHNAMKNRCMGRASAAGNRPD